MSVGIAYHQSLGRTGRFLAQDPSNLPSVTLYTCRQFCASNLWNLGVSSAWLMSQMSHKSWLTTKIYVHCEGGVAPVWSNVFVAPVWRNVFVGTTTNTFLPLSASLAPPMQEPGTTAAYLSLARKGKVQDIDVRDAFEAVAEDSAECAVDGIL